MSLPFIYMIQFYYLGETGIHKKTYSPPKAISTSRRTEDSDGSLAGETSEGAVKIRATSLLKKQIKKGTAWQCPSITC